MPEVYKVLPPICKKLEIDIPDLYYKKCKEINAYTGGTTTPYVVITSKLVEELNTEQLASVIAHECGHIACRHNLYHSMAAYLVNGINNSPIAHFPAIRKYLSPNLVKALLFWDRCSELSADRAATLCAGNDEIFVDSLLKIYGYGDNINREEFIKQAIDLRDFVDESKSAKAFQQMLEQWDSHPRLATRVYECHIWAKSEDFKKIIDGTYVIPKEVIEEKEIVAAELTASATDTKSETAFLPEGFNLDAELARVNKELERYTNHAEKIEYGFAVFSGIYAGIIDSLFVGQCTVTPEGIGLNHEQVNNFIQKYTESKKLRKDRL